MPVMAGWSVDLYDTRGAALWAGSRDRVRYVVLTIHRAGAE